MRKLFILGMAFVFSVAMLLTACKKDDPKPDNGGNNNNQETPGGGEVTPNQEYPETAVVLPQAVTDIDGNTYDAVQIGNQVWMAENLRTTRYADGTMIPLDSTYSLIEPYRYAPGLNQSNEENMTNVARYGYLYNWPAVMHGASSSDANPSGIQGICPTGWHVPSDAEWTQLTDYVSSQSQYVCGDYNTSIAKALASTTGWSSSSYPCNVGYNPSTNNATGFSALPAGRYSDFYYYFGDFAYFWSATEHDDVYAHHTLLSYYSSYVSFHSVYYKYCGFSVRCVRD